LDFLAGHHRLHIAGIGLQLLPKPEFLYRNYSQHFGYRNRDFLCGASHQALAYTAHYEKNTPRNRVDFWRFGFVSSVSIFANPLFRMPYDFHHDHDFYLDFLARNARESIMPFCLEGLQALDANRKGWQNLEVLELGCGEGGNLLPFVEAGAKGTGIDLNQKKIEFGRQRMGQHIASGRMDLRGEDIYNPAIEKEFTGRFDLIVLKDVIEHLPDQPRALKQMQKFLKTNGLLFIGWPPWTMPFGGHQQIAEGWVQKFPWIHLLPRSSYEALLRWTRQSDETREELLSIYDCGIGIQRMHRIAAKTGMPILRETHYLINPIYAYKFGLKTRQQIPVLRSLPVIRDFLTTSVYLLLQK
jgi:SAM-dependent methyltransferase